MKLGTFKKQPQERLSKSVLYEKALDPSDSVTSVLSCTVVPTGHADDLTAAPSLINGDRVRLWTDKGQDNTSYKITLKVGTAAGEIFEDELIVRVRDI